MQVNIFGRLAADNILEESGPVFDRFCRCKPAAGVKVVLSEIAQQVVTVGKNVKVSGEFSYGKDEVGRNLGHIDDVGRRIESGIIFIILAIIAVPE